MNAAEHIKQEIESLTKTDFFTMPDFEPPDPVKLSPIYEDEENRVRMITRKIISIYGMTK